MDSLTLLLNIIRQHQQGIRLDELLLLQPNMARRTVQRHIKQLIEQNKVVAFGEGRARKYFAQFQAGSQTIAEPTLSAYNIDSIPISLDAKDIAAYIERPIQGRTPVGYQVEFLADYQPNHTYYLPEPTRRQLHKMGQTSAVEQPAGTYSRAVLNRLLIDLSWASSHLEGNTYSRLDTVKLIEQGNAATGKASIETQMILNHKSAIELLVENISDVGIDRYTLLNLHATLAENLLPDMEDEGRVRQHAVDKGLSVYRPLSAPQQIEHQLEVLLGKANLITDPFEQSFFLMVHLPYLQPFADINKRTSRLMANLPLFKANLCPLTFIDVPEAAYSRATLGIYEMTRIELLRDLYVWAYERSTKAYISIKRGLSEPDPLRLKWRSFIKQTVREVVLLAESSDSTKPEEGLALVEKLVAEQIPTSEQDSVRALVIAELRSLHEGVLARYGLRPSQYEKWKLSGL
ncbi:Fic family protein [Salinibius halmophilus]|uniref:Fic family protein n=1 Tax=Salinibius halmophilus TaxID=1853216 RepID=UPI000E67128F|nr:Fic family protein [Salinibius halmophilus]